MDNSSLTYRFFETFKDDKLSFAYLGALSNQMVVSSTDLIERNLYRDKNFKKLRHKLSFLMIESFQNIIRYGDEPENKNLSYQKEMFMVRNIDGHFYIGSVNLIENKKIDFVRSKLQQVNALNGEELNDLYKKILTNKKFTDAGGAGLGFIEMARKTHHKLQYDFVKINDDYSYFYLLIKVKCIKTNGQEKSHLDISWFKQYHATACDEKIVVLHKGNFSPVVIDPVIDIVEDNIKSEAVNVQKLAFHIILEALQNLSLHSLEQNDEKEAIFIICKHEKEHHISTGNYIKKSKVDGLKLQLDDIKKLEKEELKQLYEKTALKKDEDEDNKLGLGLMEIAIESNNKLDYQFLPVSENVSFYIFDVEV